MTRGLDVNLDALFFGPAGKTDLDCIREASDIIMDARATIAAALGNDKENDHG